LLAGIWFQSQYVLAIATIYASHGPVMKIWSMYHRLAKPEAARDADEASAEAR
jgi:hypothetical protein